ncbi:MAG: TldD/PmbA family protein [Candidatus Thermoplasmatota archaeon]
MTPAKKTAKKPAARKPTKASKPTKRAAPPERNLGDELLARCERVVELALARGAQQAEAYAESAASLDVELENGRIATTGASRGAGASIRLVKDGRLGFAYWTQDAEAASSIDRALQQARLAPQLGFRFPAPEKGRRLDGRWDDRVAALEVADGITLAEELLAGAKQASRKSTVAGGGASLDHSTWALASSAGVRAWDRETGASCAASLVLQDGTRSVSSGESRSAHSLHLDARDVAAEAGRTVESLRGPKPAKAKGAKDLVLRPDAAAELVTGLAISAATGDDAMRGKTVWSGKLGQSVAVPDLDLVDDSWVSGAISASAIDGDGLPTRRQPIIDGGILRAFLFDSWDAHRHKQVSTRSAVRGGFKSRPDTGTHHLVLSSRKARALDKIIAGTDDGYLVDSVLGAHTANVTTGDFSVTSPNVWRIRKGAVEGPVTEVAIGGNLPDLLMRIDGVAKEPKRMAGAHIPAVRFRDVTVSS